MFKWVEDGVYEEVVDSLPKFSIIENAIHNAKSEAAVEIQDLEAMIKELKEEALWSKREIKKMLLLTKFCLLLLVFFAIGITVSLVMFCYSKKKNSFFLGTRCTVVSLMLQALQYVFSPAIYFIVL